MQFDLLKVFGYIERVIKSDFFFRKKSLFTSYVRNVYLGSLYLGVQTRTGSEADHMEKPDLDPAKKHPDPQP